MLENDADEVARYKDFIKTKNCVDFIINSKEHTMNIYYAKLPDLAEGNSKKEKELKSIYAANIDNKKEVKEVRDLIFNKLDLIHVLFVDAKFGNKKDTEVWKVLGIADSNNLNTNKKYLLDQMNVEFEYSPDDMINLKSAISEEITSGYFIGDPIVVLCPMDYNIY